MKRIKTWEDLQKAAYRSAHIKSISLRWALVAELAGIAYLLLPLQGQITNEQAKIPVIGGSISLLGTLALEKFYDNRSEDIKRLSL